MGDADDAGVVGAGGVHPQSGDLPGPLPQLPRQAGHPVEVVGAGLPQGHIEADEGRHALLAEFEAAGAAGEVADVAAGDEGMGVHIDADRFGRLAKALGHHREAGAARAQQ